MRLAVIPARGGSKRIPRKNIKPFCGKPMIAWSIEVALQSGCFDEMIVSTDDAETADVARRWGAGVLSKVFGSVWSEVWVDFAMNKRCGCGNYKKRLNARGKR